MESRMRGYFGIGIYKAKYDTNLGTLFRTAHNFDAAFCFTIQKAYKPQSSDTTCFSRHIPLYHYDSINHFFKHIPQDCCLIGVDNNIPPLANSMPLRSLQTFNHPERAIYILGSEINGLPIEILEKCYAIIEIKDCKYCLNVATTGAIVMYDRILKGQK